MKLIVGLGNPGKKYEGTRHNMGFMALDRFAEMLQVDIDRHDFKGSYAKVSRPDFPEPFILLKPETYMNLSGESVIPLMEYFKIEKKDLIVVYDDMALPEGEIRLRLFGSAGSHNGMKNIIALLGSDKFKRLRIGIGEPAYSGIDHVLTKPTGESLNLILGAIDKAALALRDALLQGWDYAMNHYN